MCAKTIKTLKGAGNFASGQDNNNLCASVYFIGH